MKILIFFILSIYAFSYDSQVKFVSLKESNLLKKELGKHISSEITITFKKNFSKNLVGYCAEYDTNKYLYFYSFFDKNKTYTILGNIHSTSEEYDENQGFLIDVREKDNIEYFCFDSKSF